jgi:hypothetical protein
MRAVVLEVVGVIEIGTGQRPQRRLCGLHDRQYPCRWGRRDRTEHEC